MDYKTALQCARFAQDVYQEFPDIKFRKWSGADPLLVEIDSTDTQLAILEESPAQIGTIVFRGSDKDKDWGTNFSTGKTEYEWSPEEKQSYQEQMKEG